MTTRPEAASGPAHIAALDGLRGLAILGVILFHARLPLQGAPTAIESWVDAVLASGWLGVDLFFVLSGFLITRILLETRGNEDYFRNFYIRRTLRIFPLYYFALLLFLVLLPLWADPVRPLAAEQAWFWLYVFNLRVAAFDWPSVHLLDHLWSLSIEEQFYLMWAAVVAWSGGRRLTLVCIAIVVLAAAGRIALFQGGYEWQTVYTLTPVRVDGLVLGSLMALLLREHGASARLRMAARVAWLASGALLAALFVHWRGFTLEEPSSMTTVVTIANVHFASLVLVAATSPGRSALTRSLSLGGLRWLGRYSYGMYIFHWPIIYIFVAPFLAENEFTSWPTAQVSVIALVSIATALSAVVTWHLFERRFLTLKERFAPHRSDRGGRDAIPPLGDA